MAGYPNWSDEGGDGGYGQQQLQYPPKRTSWLLPDHGGGGAFTGRPNLPVPPPPLHLFAQQGGYPPRPPPPPNGRPAANGRKPGQRRAASQVSFDTSAKDPESVRARIFIGSLNTQPVTREDVIELCLPYGALRGVTFFKNQGYAFVQFENANEAAAACLDLNGQWWNGNQMDAHAVDKPTRVGKPSATVKAVPTTTYDEIGQDTSSRDPTLMRARIFIGSLRNPVYRNDIIELCLPFGKITAVTFFKLQGYAFVQFESPVDAVAACEKLNGITFKLNVIDVHLAMEGLNRKRITPEDGDNNGADSMDCSGPTPKRPREEEEPKKAFEIICKVCRWTGGEMEEFVKHREGGDCKPLSRTGEPPSLACTSCDAVFPSAWRLLFHVHDDQAHRLKLITVDGTEAGLTKARESDEKNKEEWWMKVEKWMEEQTNEDGEAEDEKDMKPMMAMAVVCGTCSLVADDWPAFVAHRKKDCIKPREKSEPSCLVCSMCGEGFVSAWKALFHLMDFHRMKVFTPDYTKDAAARAQKQLAMEHVGVDKRMKMWIESHTTSS